MVSTHHSHDNFNPLRREGGDPSGSVGISWIMDFNPLRREGGDHPGYQGKDIRSNFNPLRREGGDTDPITGKMIPAISIHSAARAETGYHCLIQLYYQFQSTPPRGRRQQ